MRIIFSISKIIAFVSVFVISGGISYAQLCKCQILLHQDKTQLAYPRLSSNNKKILFQTNASGKWQLALLTVADTSITMLTADTCNNNFPDWDPDNKHVAFVSDRNGNEEIYMMDVDGKNLLRITNDTARDIHPYFSPDGKYILFNSTRGNGSLDIYRYTIATQKTQRLTDTPEDETCARYSPDMRFIVYLKNGVEYDDVFVLNMANFLSENITKTPVQTDGWPMYDAKGEWIYYSDSEKGSYSIYRIKPDGTSKQQLTFSQPGEEDARVFISADNKTMIYNKRKAGYIEIYRCSLKEK